MKKQKAKPRIFVKEWQELHPYHKPASSDFYFTRLSNQLLEIIDEFIQSVVSEKAKRTIALSVAAYFEDVISEFGLWQGFTKKHCKMYGKKLPFYETTEDYIPEEINPEDVLFLIWSIMELELKETKGMMLNSENPFIIALGMELFHVLEEEYETAPENENLYHFFTDIPEYEDFVDFRNVAAWLFYDSYLMSPFTDGILEKALKDVKRNDEYREAIVYTTTYELVFSIPCGPLALKTYEWMAAIAGEDTDLGKMLLKTQFKYKAPKTYLVTDTNDTGLFLLPFDSDTPIYLFNDTFSKNTNLKSGDAALCNLIYYNEKWELNGFLVNYSAKEYEKEREEAKRHKTNVEYSKNLFLKANNNKPVRYFKDRTECEDFFNVAFKPKEKMYHEHLKDYTNLISYVCDENATTTISDIATYVKDKDNPCYNKKEAEENGLVVLTRFALDKFIIDYFIKNKLLPDLSMNSLRGAKHGKKLVQENLDFLFRFFQPMSFK